MIAYGPKWDRRLAREVITLGKQIQTLSGRVNSLMLDLSDRRRELAEHAPGHEDGSGDPLVDSQYLETLALYRRWDETLQELKALQEDATAYVDRLPGNAGRGSEAAR